MYALKLSDETKAHLIAAAQAISTAPKKIVVTISDSGGTWTATLNSPSSVPVNITAPQIVASDGPPVPIPPPPVIETPKETPSFSYGEELVR